MEVLGRLIAGATTISLMLFTDLGSTGLLIMFLVDTTGALILGSKIGFSGPPRGSFSDLTKKNQ